MQGQVANTPDERQALEKQDYAKCLNPRCNYYLHPDEWMGADGYDDFDCPNCRENYSLIDETPFGNKGGFGFSEGRQGQMFKPGGQTRVGLTLSRLGDIAEDTIKEQGQIPGYGKIVWWSDTYQDPLDGATEEWAVEVKAVASAATNWRFIPGSIKRQDAMVARAKELGYNQILGLLVVLNFENSLADIYGMEMPLDPWISQAGRRVQGPVAFRHHNGTHLIEEVPFDNPFLDPNDPEPQVQSPDIPF